MLGEPEASATVRALTGQIPSVSCSRDAISQHATRRLHEISGSLTTSPPTRDSTDDQSRFQIYADRG